MFGRLICVRSWPVHLPGTDVRLREQRLVSDRRYDRVLVVVRWHREPGLESVLLMIATQRNRWSLGGGLQMTNRLRARLCIPLMLGFLAIGPGHLAFAQEATPAVDFVVPDPLACTVAPLPVESLLAVLATPAATPPTALSADAGEPADDATVAAVTKTVGEVYACLAAGDWQRADALFTDEALRGFLAQGFLTPEPFVEGPGQREAFRVREVRVLPDTRARAVIDFRVSEGVFAETWLFERRNDRYLVAAVPSSGEVAATPAS